MTGATEPHPSGLPGHLNQTRLKSSPNDHHDQGQHLPCKQQTQPFFELPAELRNWIYELALPSKHHGDQLIITTPSWDDPMILAKQPSITQVSMQTRSESLPIFYGNNEFRAYIQHYDFKALVKWVDCITSVPKPPKLRLRVYMLDNMSCNIALRDLALAWRKIKHETIHLTIASAFPYGVSGKAQCMAVVAAIKVAKERRVAGDQRDESTIRYLLQSGVLGVCKCPVIAGWSYIGTCSREPTVSNRNVPY